MSDAHEQIRNLVHRYSEAIDGGHFEVWDELFEYATIRIALGASEPGPPIPGTSMSSMTDSIILYADGTPRTRHLVNNLIIEVDEVAGSASARSYNTTLQQPPGREISIIATAQYFDTFECVEGNWRFTDRTIRHASVDGVTRDFIGDMSFHTTTASASTR
jgi:3-phenylpropionate/cinnamic acid dioxygenase small subunit